MSAEPVVVARFYYRHEAEFAQAYLDSAGIWSAVFGDDAGGMEVPLSFSNSVRLLVRGEDAGEAHEVLVDVGLAEPG
ncbi:MAG TPA: hypothetical protein VMN39_06175 [Longimicrobiaceae bacterium]|nr:hypothetical protein [Longimicrobiaceae bacterium]